MEAEISINIIYDALKENEMDISGEDKGFYTRLATNAEKIRILYNELYLLHPAQNENFSLLIQTIIHAHKKRSQELRKRDEEKNSYWFLSNELAGMSLYVDRFCGKLNNLSEKLPYLETLGINLLHLMPLFDSPANESDGGYAVSDFKKVNPGFGTLDDLKMIISEMHGRGMHLMLDIVLNHTSHVHEWAMQAKSGNKKYQDFYYMFDNRGIPDQMEQKMPEIFPESSPGNFTWVEECNKWVMTVFHNYQWDLNFLNPQVFSEMLDIVFFYANLGVDILRIDAPAFIWKQIGSSCQNLPQAHTILQLIKQCVQTATPGMALLGEAIVSPEEIIKYFGIGKNTAQECDFAYNATQMALQWDALATGKTGVMMAAQPVILQKPFGTTWITYTRCHDDIGLGYEDYMIRNAGFDPYLHRNFLKNYYSGKFEASPARGALFSVNDKTQDARISGTLASLCGLETAIENKNDKEIDTAVKKILLMQAHSFFIGGLPMIFYGDEAAYINDYSYQNDNGKHYDNRWMHRPIIDWEKNKQVFEEGTIEYNIYNGTQKLLAIRRKSEAVADHKNITWIETGNEHIAGFFRHKDDKKLYCIFNFSGETVYITWYAFDNKEQAAKKFFDHWQEKEISTTDNNGYLKIPAYSFCLLEASI